MRRSVSVLARSLAAPRGPSRSREREEVHSRPPPWRRAAGDAANAMANAAEPHVAVFIAARLRPDFLDGLRAMTPGIENSLGGRTDHVIKRRGSTIAIGWAP